jgi:hypothetical protein
MARNSAKETAPTPCETSKAANKNTADKITKSATFKNFNKSHRREVPKFSLLWLGKKFVESEKGRIDFELAGQRSACVKKSCMSGFDE